MKRVENLISKEEYAKKVEPILKEEILKSIKKSEGLLPKGLKTVTKPWYIILAILFLVAGIGLAIGILTTVVGNNTTVDAYGNRSYKERTNSEMITKFIFIGLGIVMIIVGFVMFAHKKSIMKKIDAIYRNAMDKEKIYKLSIEAFPNFKLDSVEGALSEEIYKYTYNIPGDGRVVGMSPLFTATYKDKYKLQFQSARFHWTRTVRTKNGTSTQHYYRDSGYIILEGDKKDEDFLYTMNQSALSSSFGKIDLENKEFLRATKFRSNNKIKSRMAFTPLAMEEVVKHENKIVTNFDLTKESWGFVFSMATDLNQYIIDAKKGSTDENTAQNYISDIVSDFYKFYEVIGMALIPPML